MRGINPALDDRRRKPGGASHTSMTNPAATNRKATSVPVAAVIRPTIAEMAQSRVSVRFVRRASLTAAMAMMAMTAGATP